MTDDPKDRTTNNSTHNSVDPAVVLWNEVIPRESHFSALMRRGTALRLTDLQGGANVSAIFYNFEDLAERYNMADTMKSQNSARLSRGHVLLSDMGRVLCSIIDDSLGWHDPIGGISVSKGHSGLKLFDTQHQKSYGGHDALLLELGKWGLGRPDLVPNVNFFSKVTVGPKGDLNFASNHSKAGDYVDLRFEMNVVIVLSTSRHPLDPECEVPPGSIALTHHRVPPLPANDYCRNLSPENQRAFVNTERYFL